jgi:NADPH:quinone reductase-like Zn-dependent oxidoreductase
MRAVAEVEVRSLGVARPGEPRVFTWREDGPADGQFLLQTRCSGISAGTELTFVKGSNPYLHSSWDGQFGIFRPGRPAVRYPIRTMGYMEVGEVVESRAPAVAEGTQIAMAYGHRSVHVGDPLAQSWLALPAGMHPHLGVLVAHMGPICANGLLHAAADAMGAGVRALGDGVRGRHVLVMGGGVVGLLVGLFARQHGAAEVVLADATPERRAAAEALGLQAAGDGVRPVWRVVKERWAHGAGDCGADVVFQCRGRARWLAEALRALRPQGTVIDLAFYDGGAEDLRLGEEFHHNGLTVRCAQIGRVPRGLGAQWPRRRLRAETLTLLHDHGELVRRVLVTHRVPLEDGPAFLTDLVAHRRHALLAVLEFS